MLIVCIFFLKSRSYLTVPTLVSATPPSGKFTISVNDKYLSRTTSSSTQLGPSSTQKDVYTYDTKGLKHVSSGKYVSALLTLVNTPVAFKFYNVSDQPKNIYLLQKPGTGISFIYFNNSQRLTLNSA